MDRIEALLTRLRLAQYKSSALRYGIARNVPILPLNMVSAYQYVFLNFLSTGNTYLAEPVPQGHSKRVKTSFRLLKYLGKDYTGGDKEVVSYSDNGKGKRVELIHQEYLKVWVVFKGLGSAPL